MIEDVVGEVVDQKNLKVVLGAVNVIGVDQFLDQDHDHILDQEVVAAHVHMIDIEDIDVAGNFDTLVIAYYYSFICILNLLLILGARIKDN